MHKFKNHTAALLALAFGAMLSLTVGVANADPIETYNLNDVTFNDGTTLTGFFTTNGYGYMSSIDITSLTHADPDGYGNASTINGYGYTVTSNDSGWVTELVNGKPTAVASPVFGATTVDIYRDDPGTDYMTELQLVFSAALGTTSDNIVSGYECVGAWGCGSGTTTDTTGVVRNILVDATPSVTVAVPEPTPIALLGLGLLGLIAARRRRLL